MKRDLDINSIPSAVEPETRLVLAIDRRSDDLPINFPDRRRRFILRESKKNENHPVSDKQRDVTTCLGQGCSSVQGEK